MSIPATEAVTSSPWSTATSATDQTAAQADKQMFLELMVAQLRYQDPLNPTDSGEFLAQSAQFTALEKMQDVADRTAELLGAQMAFGASGLVGRHVSWTTGEGDLRSGTVDGVTFGAEGPVFDIDGTEVPLVLITSVTAEPPSAPTTDTDDTSSSTSAS